MNDDKNQTKEHLTERFKQLFEGMSSGVAVYEAVDGGNDFIIKDFNRAAEEIDQIKREDIIGRRVTEVFPEVEEFGLLEVLRQVWKTGSSRNYPISFYKDERITGGRENYIYKLPSGKVVAIYDDITERKRAEERIEHLNLVLRAVRNVNQLITQEKDPARLLQGSCEILTSTRGYHNAWIALLDESGKLLRSAESEVGEDFAAVIKRLERGELIECAKKALPSSEVQMIGEPLVDCGDCPLADTYSGRSALVKRLEHEGKVYGILAASIPRELASDEEEQDIFSEVADDIAFALHNFEVEEERKRVVEELKAANQQLTASEQHLRAANQQLSASEQQLRAANQQLRAIEKDLRTVNLALRERVKELNYFYQLSTLNEKPNITLEEILQGVVELIPSSYQYPKITCGRIILGDQEFKTENFRETSWKQTANLIARGKRTGTMEVCYLEERPERDEGPFLEEERKLIDAIAERSGKIIERKQAEEEIEKLSRFPGENPYPILRVNRDGTALYANKSSRALLDVWKTREGQRLPDHWGERVKRVLDSNQSDNFEEKCGNATFLLILAPVAEMGYANVYGLDITERKQEEKELEQYREHLEVLVNERTVELNKKLEELERFHNAMVDREFRIKELRDEVDRLKNTDSHR